MIINRSSDFLIAEPDVPVISDSSEPLESSEPLAPVTPESGDISYECDEEWSLHPNGKHCFKKFTTPLSWESANENCADLGGSLANIHNARTNKMLAKVLRRKDR